MKRICQKILVLSFFCGFVTQGYSQDNTLFNENKVDPEVTVEAVSKVVNAGNLKEGELEVTFQYWVEVDADKVNLSCLVSDLNWSKSKSKPVSVDPDSSRGCRIEAVDAYSIAGKRAELVKFKKERHTIDGRLDALKSDYVTFRTLDTTDLRSNVFVTVSWFRPPGSKPVGNYEGIVKLIAKVPDIVQPVK